MNIARVVQVTYIFQAPTTQAAHLCLPQHGRACRQTGKLLITLGCKWKTDPSKALITAVIDKVDYGPIRDATKGILFLSTPHRGSDVTPWPKLMSNVGNVIVTYTKSSGFFGKFRSDLVELLEKGSKELNTVGIEFRNQHKGITLVSFYETDSTPPFTDPVSMPVPSLSCAGLTIRQLY